MARLSPGRLTALWIVLRTLEQFGGLGPTKEIKTYASRTSLRSGGLPIHDGYELARKGEFIVEDSGAVRIAPLGEEALRIGTEPEPNDAVLQLFLSVLVLRHPPSWVAFWQGNAESLDLVLPDNDRKLLKDSGFFPPLDPEDFYGWAWWKALEMVPIPEDSGHRKKIGDAGEKLTLEFERTRLEKEGFSNLAKEVRWVAQESPAYGFDVASYQGLLSKKSDKLKPDTPLAIEVKSQSTPAHSEFRLYLTRHEWETSLVLWDRYIYHLWDGVSPSPSPSTSKAAPMILTPDALEPHLPNNPDCGCKWQTAHLRIPLPAPVPNFPDN